MLDETGGCLRKPGQSNDDIYAISARKPKGVVGILGPVEGPRNTRSSVRTPLSRVSSPRLEPQQIPR